MDTDVLDRMAFWGSPGDRPFGLNERQVAYCRARLDGNTQAASAKIAGYAGKNDEAYRAVGCKTEASKLVQAALKAAKAATGELENVGDANELLSLLWQEARRGQGSAKISAMTLIHRIEEEKARPEALMLDCELLDRAAGDNPVKAALCVLIARDAAMTAENGSKYLMKFANWRKLKREQPEIASFLKRANIGGHRDEVLPRGPGRPPQNAPRAAAENAIGDNGANQEVAPCGV